MRENRESLISRRQYARVLGVTAALSVGAGTTGTVTADGGEINWVFETGGSVQSSPSVVDGTVYVGSYDKNLYAVDTTTGTQEWAFQTNGQVYSSPTVIDNIVYVGSRDNKIYAVDTDLGTEYWSFETDDSINSSPTVVDSTVYIGSDDGNVYALDTATGEQEWVFETGNSVDSSPTVVDDTVYVGSHDDHVYALDTVTGEQKWAFETDRLVTSSPAVVDDTIFVGSGDFKMYALNTTTGEKIWDFEPFGSIAHTSSPTVIDGTVYFGNPDRSVYAVDATTGEQKWEFETENFVDSSPTVADNIVYVGSGDGNVYALDAATGDQEWMFETSDSVISSPTVVNGTVYVGSADNSLYALDAGVDGSSEASRVYSGTLGHHHVWADEQAGTGNSPSDDPIFSGAFDYSPTEPEAGDTIVFDARSTSVEHGTVESYEWDFTDDGSTDETGDLVTRQLDPGIHIVGLRVTTEDGTIETFTEPIEVADADSAVIDPRVEVSPDDPTAGESIVLDASETAVGNSTIERYKWDLTGDGSIDESGEAVTTEFETGTHTVSLTVTAADGTTSSDTILISVDVDVELEAAFEYDPLTPAVGEDIQFDASNSTASGSEISQYEWDFIGDGTTDMTGEKAVHSFEEGTHQVTLTIRDNQGNETSTQQLVEVGPEQVNVSVTTNNTEVEIGETTEVVYSVSNFITSAKLTVQLLVETPSDVNITGVSGADEGSNQFTATTTLDPASQESVRVSLVANAPGEHAVSAIADYYFGDDPADSDRTVESLVITAGSDNDGESSGDGSSGGGASSDDIISDEVPGFGVGEAIMALSGVGYVVKKRISGSSGESE